MGQALTFSVFAAEKPVEILTLKQTIENAIEANIGLKSSQEGTKAAQATQKERKTLFLPTFNATYKYNRDDEAYSVGGIEFGAKQEYSFITTVTQPIFTGFANLNQYKIASLGLDVAEISEKLVRQDIIFNAKKIYFSIS